MTESANHPQLDASGHGHLGSPELEQNDYSKYLLYSRSEILYLLRAVMQKSCMLTVYFDNGRQFFLTALLAISEDGNWLYFDPGSDDEINRNALAAKKLLLSTMLDKVKIQFSLPGLQTAKSGTRSVFAARLPETILRLQRREYYRLTTPIADPLRCKLAVPTEGGAQVAIESTVLDISGGGIGLTIPTELGRFMEPGTLIPDARINLPDEGPITVTLCVRNAFDVTTKSGHHYFRAGCEFVDLPGTRLTMIQRYITRVERERKARASGNE